MPSVWSRFVAGIKAFREAYITAGDSQATEQWSDYDARRLRYELLWSYYDNTAYRDIHTWSRLMRTEFGLYKYTRGIHNPAYRLGEFYATHLLGGALDMQTNEQGVRRAGSSGAVPIQTSNDQLRIAIAQLWRWSNWQTTKDIWTRTGAVLGDIGLKAVDDPLRKKVYLQVVHPSTIRDVERDPWGNVRGYVIQEERPDPRVSMITTDKRPVPKTVTYTEIAERDGDDVVYTTQLNGSAYAWNGVEATWRESYGFVPLVLVQHLNVGLEWGWGELQAGLGKVREVDDLASKLSDQIRKMVDAPWLFGGVKDPGQAVQATRTAPTADRPEPGREEIPAFYGPVGATATPLVANLDIEATSNRILALVAEIERDYPELQMDIWTASGDASGRALRVARQRVTGKAQMRRAGYDDGLVRAQQMAVAIGGQADYAGFEPFDLDSYAAGDLDHTIADRPVFEVDPLDDLEEVHAFWEAAELAVKSGARLESYLRERGWNEQQIAVAIAALPMPPAAET